MQAFLLSWLLPVVAACPAEPTAAATFGQDGGVLQIRAKTVLLGDGERLENGVVAVEGGKIRSVGPAGTLNEELPWIEHPGVLSSGMVVAHSWFGAEGENNDPTRSVLAEARVVYAFRPEHSAFHEALEQGITSMVLAPTGQNLAGGKTCVVKTSGVVLKQEAHLALSFSKEALGQGVQQFFFLFSADAREALLADGLEETGGNENGGRIPTSYAGSMAALEELIQAKDGVFARARAGEIPVLLEAWDRNEVARAVAFAQKHHLHGAVRGAPLAGDLTAELKESGLGVVLGPFDAGEPSRTLEGAGILARAGVPLAFSLGSSDIDPSVARFQAAMALAAGLEPAAAWKALSSDAARIAGVADRVGRIERGLDADLVLWSGEPLDLSSKVEMVFIDGKRVYGGGK
jgi:imidazolonepropionase-like amidohydrolase